MKLRTLTLIYSLALAFGSTALLVPALALADGTQTYATPGTYTFVVPNYTGTLSVGVSGAGGGGGGGSWNPCLSTVTELGQPGGDGGNSSFNGTIIGQGGGGGSPESPNAVPPCVNGDAGTNGGGSGGTTKVTGGGSAGGAGGEGYPNPNENPPYPALYGGAGGNGGQSSITYLNGTLTAGQSIIVVVGSGGTGGARSSNSNGSFYSYPGTAGQNGTVSITWTPAPNSPPTCSVTFDENPLTDSSTTIHWTSSGATLFYINGMGYVGATGSATIYSAGDYSGAVSGPGGNGSCPATLQSSTGNLCPDGSPAPNDDPNQCTCAHGNLNACPNYCPAGETWNGAECIHSCPAGETWNGAECVKSCPAGYTLQDGQCVFNGCPAGYTQETDANGNTICVLTTCPTGYVSQDGQCIFQGCPPGYTQEGTLCVFIPQNPPSGDIIAIPSLVKPQETTNISWSAQYVSACSISATNGDGWNCSAGFCNATTTKTSSPIKGHTVYTLSCTGTDSSTFTKSATVGIVPSFCEPGAPACN